MTEDVPFRRDPSRKGTTGAGIDPQVRWHQVRVPAVGQDSVQARVFHPYGPSRGWLVWAHGGSWTGGSVAGWHLPCADLAGLAGCTVVSVEYRVAPRHPHPAALEDVLAVLDWAADQACAEGGALAVGGDSAGGTIAACAALSYRDQGRALAGQVLAYPPLDPTCSAASYRRGVFPLRNDLLASWRLYRGNRGPLFASSSSGRATVQMTPAYSTPFDADDLRDGAPTVLAVGGQDAVLDDVLEYAERLRRAQVDVVLREFFGLPHGVFLQPGPIPGSRPSPVPENPVRQWLARQIRDLLGPRAVPVPDPLRIRANSEEK